MFDTGYLAPEVDLINPSKNDSTEGKMSFLTLQPLGVRGGVPYSY